MRLRIVLVEPREAGNVGAVARAMKNFGHSDLWIVGDSPQLAPVAGWWASGAEDVVAGASHVRTLGEALADAQLTIATTSARGRTAATRFDPSSLAQHCRSLAETDRVAMVFGREDSGLTREEIVQCQQTAVIPTHVRFPTMNLAQSVCLFCYELSAAGDRGSEPRILAEASMIERMHARAEALLLEIGFLHANNPGRIYEDLRALVARADPDQREVTILLGILHQLEWKLRQ